MREPLRGRSVDQLLRSLGGRGAEKGQTSPTSSTRVQTAAATGIDALLSRRGIAVRIVGEHSPEDVMLAALARQIVHQWRDLWPVCRLIRRGGRTPTRFQLAAKPGTAAIAFCERAHRVGLLRDCRLVGGPAPKLWIETNAAPVAQAFFGGGWLERYVREEVRTAFGAVDGVQRLWNVVVRLPDGADFEFDHLALYGGRLLWIESKTGAYQPSLDRYRRVGRLLGVAADSAWVVVSGRQVSGEAARTIRGLFGVNIVRPPEVRAMMARWIESGRYAAERDPDARGGSKSGQRPRG